MQNYAFCPSAVECNSKFKSDALHTSHEYRVHALRKCCRRIRFNLIRFLRKIYPFSGTILAMRHLSTGSRRCNGSMDSKKISIEIPFRFSRTYNFNKTVDFSCVVVWVFLIFFFNFVMFSKNKYFISNFR